MGLKITFVNPNSEQDVDKYLPKILAQAIIDKITREINEKPLCINHGDIKHSA